MNDALQDDDWYKAMEEDFDQIKKNKTWSLVPRPVDKNVIGTKWVFRNKLDENGEVIRIRKDYSAKDMHKKKELAMERHFPLLQDWKE